MNTSGQPHPRLGVSYPSPAARIDREGWVGKPLSRPEWLPESIWPFASIGIDVEDSTIAVAEAGKGPVLLFVHTGVWSFIWRDVILRLADNFRCVCLDAPGSGQSSRLPGEAISLERSARAVTAVIEALDLQDLSLVVHDLGGLTGIAGGARKANRVRGIAALNTFGWKPSGKFFRGMLALMGSAPIRELDVLTEFLSRISSSSFGVGRHMDALSRQVFRAGIDPSARRAFHNYMRDARHCDALYAEVQRALTGPFQNLPFITIFGELNDPLGFQPRWKTLFPKARQIVVKKGHHFPMCDNPDLVADSIRSWHRDEVMPTLHGILPPPLEDGAA